MDYQLLIRRAQAAMEQAYAPYSGCRVGAALLCTDGTVFDGCNIENAAFGPTVCAERVAVFKAVSQGCRDFAAIAVCGGKDGKITDFFPPCGVCRQVLREFCRDDLTVILIGPNGIWEKTTLGELLPRSFRGEDHLG